jgi:hypothetical protein
MSDMAQSEEDAIRALERPQRCRQPPVVKAGPQKSGGGKRGEFVTEAGDEIKKKVERKKENNEFIPPIKILWNIWVFQLRAKFGVSIESSFPVGSDFGHLRNLLKYCGKKREIAESILEIVLTKWKDIQNKFFRARGKEVPDLYLVDCLKQDLLQIVQGVTKLDGVVGGVHRGVNIDESKYGGWKS